MGKIQRILDKNSAEVYPLTHERAVRDSNGVNLETKLGQIIHDETELREDVGNRQRSTAHVDLSPGTWTDGKAIDALQGDVAFGTQQTSTSFSITALIDVSACVGYTLTYTRWIVGTSASSTTKKCGFVFYTSGVQAISGETMKVDSNSGTYEYSSVIVPSNAKYARFTFPTANKSNFSAYYEYEVVGDYTSGLGKQLNDLEKEVLDDIYLDIDTSRLTQWHRIILSSNKWQSYGSGYLSVDVPITPGEKYLVQAKTSPGSIALLHSETYESGEYPDYCESAYGVINFAAGESYAFVAPEDAAFLYMRTQSGGEDWDTEANQFFISSTIETIKKGEAPLCVCRYNRGALNPNGLYNNSYISITRRFNSSYDSVLVFGNKDAAAVTNKFWDLFGLYVMSRGADAVNYPPDVISFGTGIAASTTTDSILPIIVGAVNNADGDNTSHWFTGQNHAYGNTSTGASRTMREASCNLSVDGVPVGIGKLAVRGKVCTIEVVNFVQGFNTVKEDGTGREIIKQKISVRCSNDECSVRVEYLALEDVVFYNIPGFGMYGNPNTGRKFRLIGSLTKPKEYDFDGTQVNPSASDNKVNAIQISRNGIALEMRLKDIGLGNMMLNQTENNAYATTANKVYTRLTASDTEFSLPQGGLLAFEFDISPVDNILSES